MDYETWLRAFRSELAEQKPGMSLDDLDALYLQSIYHKGLSPIEAVHKALVFRGDVPDGRPFEWGAFWGRVRWDYVVPALAMLLVAFVVFRSHQSIEARQSQVPALSTTPGSNRSEGDFFALGDVSFSGRPDEEGSQSGGFPPHRSGTRVAPNGAAADGSDGNSASDQTISGTGDNSTTQGRTGQITNEGSLVTTYGMHSTLSGQTNAPQMPNITEFEVSTSDQTNNGFAGQVTWQVQNAEFVELLLDGEVVSSGPTLEGSYPFVGLPGATVFTLRAEGGGKTVEQTAQVGPN